MKWVAAIRLVTPSAVFLPGYVEALRRGWSRSNVESDRIIREDLEAIERDPDAFLASLDDHEGRGTPIRLPDGSMRPRLPALSRWIVDGEFCGAINLRWQHGTPSLPPDVLGHVGFTIVPWKRGRGCATRALSLVLPQARLLGLPFIELTADAENVASQKVIVSNGGVLIERFRKGPESWVLRFRICLADVPMDAGLGPPGPSGVQGRSP